MADAWLSPGWGCGPTISSTSSSTSWGARSDGAGLLEREGGRVLRGGGGLKDRTLERVLDCEEGLLGVVLRGLFWVAVLGGAAFALAFAFFSSLRALRRCLLFLSFSSRSNHVNRACFHPATSWGTQAGRPSRKHSAAARMSLGVIPCGGASLRAAPMAERHSSRLRGEVVPTSSFGGLGSQLRMWAGNCSEGPTTERCLLSSLTHSGSFTRDRNQSTRGTGKGSGVHMPASQHR